MLDGDWEKEASKLSLEELEAFWRELFEQESVVDDRGVDPIGPVRWDIINPVTAEEITVTINAP